jgi:hypothetical protein
MSTATAPHFLGFDVRLDPVNLARGWSAKRRTQFLLRDDIDVPISIDPMVWPSRFWQRHVPPGMGMPRHLGTVAVPDATAGYTSLGLWTDLDQLKRFARARDVAIDTRTLIAILAWPGDEQDVARPSLVTGGPLPDIAGWTTLGFDVADDSFVSGLNNCGYEADERIGLTAAWGSNLNHHGLLTGLDAARRFAGLTDARVPEHAPFLVFELRRPEADSCGWSTRSAVL